MRSGFRKAVVAASIVGVSLMAAVPAFAVDPTAPTDPTTTAGSVLANVGNSILTTIGSLASNAWALALFGFGLAMAIVVRIVNKHKHAKTPLG